MADKKISALTAAITPLAGAEVLPVVQSGNTVNVSVDNLTTGKTVTANKFYAPSTDATPLDIRRSVSNSTALALVADSPSLSNTNYVLFGVDITGGSVGYSTGGVFVSTGANGTGTARPLILHTYGNNDIVFARQNTAIASITANGFAPVAGKGIDFSANTHAAGMTSELLDWYEEGTWTPTQGTFTTWTSPVFNARYTRIGNQVTLFVQQTQGTIASGGAGKKIGGLPFNPAISGSATSTNGSIQNVSDLLVYPGSEIFFVSDTGSQTSLTFTISYTV